MQVIDRFKSIDERKLIFTSVTLLIAIFIGKYSQELFFPELAFIIRDLTAMLLEIFGFKIHKFNSPYSIGIALPEYTNASEILHGAMIAECLGIPILMSFFGYLYLITFYDQKQVLSKAFIGILSIKSFLGILGFIFFSIVRYFMILFTFTCLWNTQYWPFHYVIGHDFIGNLVQSLEILFFLIIVHKIPFPSQRNLS